VTKTLQWGDVPAWMSAIVSLLALCSAVYGVTQAWRVLKLQRDADRRAEEKLNKRLGDERRAQAAKVSAWIAMVHEGAAAIAVANVRNASELPVYGLTAGIHLNGQVAETLDIGVLPPDAEPLRRPLTASGRPADPRGVELAFRDSAGLLWNRSPEGKLTETDTGTP
jgi:hypothetical protein